MSNIFETEYKQLLMRCFLKGKIIKNRTAIETYTLFNQNINIDLKCGFPIVTGKKIFFDKALHEFKWIFEGRVDLDYLNKNGINWWNDFAKYGDLKIIAERTFNAKFEKKIIPDNNFGEKIYKILYSLENFSFWKYFSSYHIVIIKKKI